MKFFQTIIQVIVGAAVLRTLPIGTILVSPISGYAPYRFCGIVGDKVTVALGRTWQPNATWVESFSIEYVTTNWAIEQPKAVLS